MFLTTISSLLALFTAINHVLAATPIVSAVGSKFFTSDGNQFYIKGKSGHSTKFGLGSDLLTILRAQQALPTSSSQLIP